MSLAISQDLHAQGCVAVRQFSSCGSGDAQGITPEDKILTVALNYRWFMSDRHYRGFHEEPDRQIQQTQVVNRTHAVDLALAYNITNRFNVEGILPLTHNTRSSLYEHGRTERRNSGSFGIGDVRLGANYWVFDPEKRPGGNLSVGLGVKLPTGDYAAMDTFYNVGPDGEAELRPVDQSIQLGDGGWGAALSIRGFGRISPRWISYGEAFYLSNPRETNGTRTYRETLSPLLQNEAIMSVADQYFMRGGITYLMPGVEGLAISGGARWEGIPVRDLIGGSDGFRRPGYVISVEPGLNYRTGMHNFNINMPISLVRNRPQSLTDIETQNITGIERHGDAAFADYVINIGYTFRLDLAKNRNHGMNMPMDGPVTD